MITLERLAPKPFSESALRQRIGLTRQEAKVARLLAKGSTNAAIAAQLCIGPHGCGTIRKRSCASCASVLAPRSTEAVSGMKLVAVLIHLAGAL